MELIVATVAQIREEYPMPASSVPASTSNPAISRHRVLEDQLASLKRENDELNHAMFEAAQVQRRLCGPRYFRTDSYEFAGEIFPVRHLSGDFISVMQIEDDFLFALGDIAGKGLLAGMWFTHMVGMIRREISEHGDPANALSAVDRNLLLSGVEFPLTTLFVARLNTTSGDLIYCNAGHPPALLVRDNHEVEELSEGGPVLGAISGAPFANGHARLDPGASFIAYSDGVLECRDEAGVEFGGERLLSAVQTLSASGPSALLFSVLASVENFVGSRHREDDIALMVLHRLGSSELTGSDRVGSANYVS
jgi:serine phosphatase RsbU (regulator of sigma subunit)